MEKLVKLKLKYQIDRNRPRYFKITYNDTRKFTLECLKNSYIKKIRAIKKQLILLISMHLGVIMR